MDILDHISIYATPWRLKSPRHEDIHTECEWIEVTAQAVPPHIASSAPGLGYEKGDPYADPPAVVTNEDGDAGFIRAFVSITEKTENGTVRHPQEYLHPLLTFDGKQYASMTFDELHNGICDALRSDRPRLALETIGPDGQHTFHFEDGTSRNS